MATHNANAAGTRLNLAVDFNRDHVRGNVAGGGAVRLVVYGDYLCPHCRGLFQIVAQLRSVMGDSLVYAFRHLPNERAHPGAELLACATEAAGAQERFWEMHDWLYEQHPSVSVAQMLDYAQSIGMDADRFQRDLNSEEARTRVLDDLLGGRANGIAISPTLFIDGTRYDDAWDFHSLLEALRRPVAAQLQRSARAFANLPASTGLILLLASAAALVCANTPIAPNYHALMGLPFSIGGVSMMVADWFSEGLLSVFFLLVGLEIRREVMSGALADPKAAVLPVVAAIGAALVPAAIYFAITTPETAIGWSVPTATDVAFTIGILVVLGKRVPSALRVFVAALAVVDSILSVLTLAIFYPREFDVTWLFIGGFIAALLFALNRARVYVGWPYVAVACALWLSFHAAGIHAALAGLVLAASLPTRPTPAAGPLLAQAATALAELEDVEREARRSMERPELIQQEPIWESAGRNLLAASARLLSPTERIERAIAPWSAYFVLPLFAFSATGVDLTVNLLSEKDIRLVLGVVIGLVIGKPIGVLLASWLAIRAGIGIPPSQTAVRAFVGAACLCGIGGTVSLLMADQAFGGGIDAAVAKIGVIVGSVLAAALGAAIIFSGSKRTANSDVISRQAMPLVET